jgi:hypothetical protein
MSEPGAPPVPAGNSQELEQQTEKKGDANVFVALFSHPTTHKVSRVMEFTDNRGLRFRLIGDKVIRGFFPRFQKKEDALLLSSADGRLCLEFRKETSEYETLIGLYG